MLLGVVVVCFCDLVIGIGYGVEIGVDVVIIWKWYLVEGICVGVVVLLFDVVWYWIGVVKRGEKEDVVDLFFVFWICYVVYVVFLFGGVKCMLGGKIGIWWCVIF